MSRINSPETIAEAFAVLDSGKQPVELESWFGMSCIFGRGELCAFGSSYGNRFSADT